MGDTDTIGLIAKKPPEVSFDEIKLDILRILAEHEPHLRERAGDNAVLKAFAEMESPPIPSRGATVEEIVGLLERLHPSVSRKLVQDALEILNDETEIRPTKARFWTETGTVWRITEKGLAAAKRRTAKKRGRPRVDEKRHRTIVNAWNTGNYRTYEACARELGEGFTARDVKLAVGREDKRRRDRKPRLSSGSD